MVLSRFPLSPRSAVGGRPPAPQSAAAGLSLSRSVPRGLSTGRRWRLRRLPPPDAPKNDGLSARRRAWRSQSFRERSARRDRSAGAGRFQPLHSLCCGAVAGANSSPGLPLQPRRRQAVAAATEVSSSPGLYLASGGSDLRNLFAVSSSETRRTTAFTYRQWFGMDAEEMPLISRRITSARSHRASAPPKRRPKPRHISSRTRAEHIQKAGNAAAETGPKSDMQTCGHLQGPKIASTNLPKTQRSREKITRAAA